MNHDGQRTGHDENLLAATAYGGSIEAIKMAALDSARELYGPDALLQIESMSRVSTAARQDRGKFVAKVYVRRVDRGEA